MGGFCDILQMYFPLQWSLCHSHLQVPLVIPESLFWQVITICYSQLWLESKVAESIIVVVYNRKQMKAVPDIQDISYCMAFIIILSRLPHLYKHCSCWATPNSSTHTVNFNILLQNSIFVRMLTTYFNSLPSYDVYFMNWKSDLCSVSVLCCAQYCIHTVQCSYNMVTFLQNLHTLLVC